MRHGPQQPHLKGEEARQAAFYATLSAFRKETIDNIDTAHELIEVRKWALEKALEFHKGMLYPALVDRVQNETLVDTAKAILVFVCQPLLDVMVELKEKGPDGAGPESQ